MLKEGSTWTVWWGVKTPPGNDQYWGYLTIKQSLGKCCHPGKEKNEKLHFCIDLRKLNSLMVNDAYSLPRIQDTLDHLQDVVLFTLLDIKSRYWQVELKESSKGLTAFTVGPLGSLSANECHLGWWMLQRHSNALCKLVWATCSCSGALSILMMSSFLKHPRRAPEETPCHTTTPSSTWAKAEAC